MSQVYSAVCLWRQEEKTVLHNSPRPLTMLCRVDQAGYVAIWMLVFAYQLVGVTYFVEAKDVGQTRINLAGDDQFVDRGGLLIVGQMATLEALLHHPMIA